MLAVSCMLSACGGIRALSVPDGSSVRARLKRLLAYLKAGNAKLRLDNFACGGLRSSWASD
eukprot:scaffold104281_cov39-Prasinocladus_malaysianus.AAC.1